MPWVVESVRLNVRLNYNRTSYTYTVGRWGGPTPLPINPEVCRTAVYEDRKTARRGPGLDGGDVTNVARPVQGQSFEKVPKGWEVGDLLDPKPKGILGGGRVSRCNAARFLSIELGL